MNNLIISNRILFRIGAFSPILERNLFLVHSNTYHPISNKFKPQLINSRFYSISSKNIQQKSNIKANEIKNNSTPLANDIKKSKIEASIKRKQEMEKFKKKVSEKSQKFKLFALLTLKKYGKLGAITYFGVYITTLMGFTLASYNGFLSSEDIKKGLKLLHMEHLKCPDLDGKFGRFFVAYVACKMVEPIRLVATIIIVTILSRIMSIRALKNTLIK